MEQYTILCKQEQAVRTMELGAELDSMPCELAKSKYPDKTPLQLSIAMTARGYFYSEHFEKNKVEQRFVKIPTAEQMCGWLRDKGLFIDTTWHYNMYDKISTYTSKIWCQFSGIMANLENQRFIYVDQSPTYKESLLECIDRALDYLESFNNK